MEAILEFFLQKHWHATATKVKASVRYGNYVLWLLYDKAPDQVLGTVPHSTTPSSDIVLSSGCIIAIVLIMK